MQMMNGVEIWSLCRDFQMDDFLEEDPVYQFVIEPISSEAILDI